MVAPPRRPGRPRPRRRRRHEVTRRSRKEARAAKAKARATERQAPAEPAEAWEDGELAGPEPLAVPVPDAPVRREVPARWRSRNRVCSSAGTENLRNSSATARSTKSRLVQEQRCPVVAQIERAASASASHS